MKKIPQRQKGFTLIEIMIVVVILGILAAMVAPKLLNRPDEAKKTVAGADIGAVSQALELYRLDNGFYPSTDQGLEALSKKTTTEPVPKKFSPDGYLKKSPKDPWGNPYRYEYPGNHGKYDIYSLGADGREGGDGPNEMITNWTNEE